MNCNDASILLHAYLDKQLDAANAHNFESHVKTCKKCSRLLANERALQISLQAALPYYQAPEHLEEKILNKLHDVHSIKTEVQTTKRSRLAVKTLAVACSLVLGVSSFMYYQHHENEGQLISEVLNGHIRALASSNLTDIRSSKADAINHWLKGKLDYAVKVPDLKELNFQLLGAKLDFIQKQKVASIVYSKNNKIINLFIWPSPDKADAVTEMHIKQGYKLVYWCKEYMNYWVISDVDEKTLMQVRKMIR